MSQEDFRAHLIRYGGDPYPHVVEKALGCYVWDETGRKVQNLSNLYLQDRQAMKTHSFSGIDGVRVQDQAAQETMGRIIDRTQEHLGESDRGIIMIRRRFVEDIKAIQRGEEPKAVYRDPAHHWDLYELAEEFVDLEDQFRQWRYRHVTTVERVIGFKRGTGGTSGVGYLRKMLDVVLFPELWALRTEL